MSVLPNKDSVILRFALLATCEVRYCSEFLSRTGWSLRWTLEDSWLAFSDRFLILDASSVDLFWPKYTTEEERWRTYDGNPRFEEVGFSLWVSIFKGLRPTSESPLDFHW